MGALRDSSSVPPANPLPECRGGKERAPQRTRPRGSRSPGSGTGHLPRSRNGVGKQRLWELPLGRPVFAILHQNHSAVRGGGLGSTAKQNSAATTHPMPLIPCTWAFTLLSRASIEKGNRCLLEQNAVYAEQVEINLQELFQSVAGSSLMATYQPFWGEMIYC